MDNIELYINGELCDTGKNFGVRLKRQLISPSELNTKDAQMSYGIVLPPTPTNNRLFGYSIVEEIRGKFVRLNDAELIINSYRVFKGRFLLNQIDRNGYAGNLVIPVSKTVKDIFGDTKLTDNAPFDIEFSGFAMYVNYWNGLAKKGETPPCIFPYVLYGLLPKVSGDTEGNAYSDRDLWDGTTRFGVQDLPPSINVLTILKHIFESKGYTLSGTAFDDVRLKKLYTSYKNDPNYTQPWNWGLLSNIHITGQWYNVDFNENPRKYEKGAYINDGDRNPVYTCDLFNSTNSKLMVYTDTGSNVLLDDDAKDENGNTWTNCQIMIPASGYYKVTLNGSQIVTPSGEHKENDQETGIQFVGDISRDYNLYDKKRYEIKLLRDWGTGDFGLSRIAIDGLYFRPNLPQNTTFDADNTPKYFPKVYKSLQNPDGSPVYNSVLLVDPVQNPNLVAGLSFGNRPESEYNNPVDSVNSWCRCLVAKSGLSYDNNANQKEPNRIAVSSPGYMRYGILDKYNDVEAGEDDQIGYEDSKRFAIDLENSPINYAHRGGMSGIPGDASREGNGSVSVVVWLNRGELLTVVASSDEGKYRRAATKGKYGWTNQTVNFGLSIEPFRTDSEWLQVDFKGDGIKPMNWDDPANFKTYEIDLIKFLPNDVRTDEFIDNFCKAFNLKLSQTGTNAFALDVKQAKKSQQNNFIDIDAQASVNDKTNQPLNLPSAYSIGFTVDTDEEGYAQTKDNGGGVFYTGAIDGNVTEQKSTFSYNWFKDIRKTEIDRTVVIPLPVISKAEVWTTDTAYPEAMRKRYTNLAQRFWYFDGLLNDLGATFKFGRWGDSLELAKVSNVLPGLNTLSYKDEDKTILNNYFSLLTDANSHYTLVECYLQPEQYEEIGKGAKVRFNGDMYYVACVTGYDPLNKNKTTLELIRLI